MPNSWLNSKHMLKVINSKAKKNYIATMALCSCEFKGSSIIMEIDQSETYLATGDVNGLVKLWNIREYCLNVTEGKAVCTVPGEKVM
jgi:hypothetical protein